MKDLLAVEGQINDAMVDAMEKLALVPGLSVLSVEREPIGVVPRLGCFVTNARAVLADVVARTPRLGDTLAAPASDVDRFLAQVIDGAKQDDLKSTYEDLMMHYIVDFASDYPAPDDLGNEDGPRFFDPNTMLWIARIYHAVVGGLSVGGVAPRLREDLRAYTGLRD